MGVFAASILDLNTAVVVATALIIGFFTLVRGRADVWKSNYEGEKERADNLQVKLTDAQAKIIKLEGAPNVDKLFQIMVNHDANAAERNKHLIRAIDRIANKVK